MDINARRIDVQKREEGDWVTDIPDWGDLRLKVRGINNADWRRLQAKLIEAVPRQKRLRGMIDPEEQDRINRTCLLNTCLLDWANLSDNGSAVPYSKETARALLFDPECEPFQDAVTFAARVVAERMDNAAEDAVGNSPAP
jgi:hypothetical protein